MYRLLALFFPALLSAQSSWVSTNTQLHWDFHREITTATIEIFEADRWGTTFFFTDFDFDTAGQSGSYVEISRGLKLLSIGNSSVNASLQFNDGLLSGDTEFGKGIPRTVLGGISLSELQFGTAIFKIQVLARQEFAADLGWQLTGVWDWKIPKIPVEFLGYVDWNSNETGHQPVSIQTEPQLQIHWNHWALGSEVEISRNFSGAWTKNNGFEYHQWYVHPTIYLRAIF